MVVNDLKKGDRLKYQHAEGSPSYKLKVKSIVTWGDVTLAKCKVITKEWYEEVYITQEDLSLGRART